MSQGQLVFSGAVKSQTVGCSPERLISKSSNSHLRDERFISERRLERPTGGPALQGWRIPVRVPATGATRGDVGDCVGQGRGCGRGGRDGTPCAWLGAWRWAGGLGPASRPSSGDLGRHPGRAVSGDRRPRPAHPYAVPRRTRRRGAAGPTAWGRRRAGAAGACCAR